MYVVLRSDIWMDAGKAAAQAGHAFVGVTLHALEKSPERFQTYQPDPTPNTKVVLMAKLREIRKLQYLCEDRGIPMFTMVDSGHIFPPDFDGKKEVLTAIGIGPLFNEEGVDLLGHLGLFKVQPKLKHRKER